MHERIKKWVGCWTCWLWLAGYAAAQPALPYTKIPLDNFAAFQRPSATTWRIVGGVMADRRREEDLQTTSGQGMLVVHPVVTNRGNLFTRMTHGDLELEFDFLMPKGSNSGVYLQGRYEVQLLDSWRKDTLTNSDCGGLYQRYDDSTKTIFGGTAPMLNASKAPGLWQHMYVRFRAPRFDAQGRKTANALFEEVKLNGVRIHLNKDATGPTMSAAFPDEQPLGPLMFQGDHGPVAFRNIQYKAFTSGQIRLSNMQYKAYKGLYKSVEAMADQTPVRTGTTDTLSWRLGDRKAQLAVEGDMEVPRSGDYLFRFVSGGWGWLFIDGKPVIDTKGNRDFERSFYATQTLTAGKHRFQLYYGNSDESLVWYYEGPGIPWTPLTTPRSYRHTVEPEPLPVTVADRTELVRGFMLHAGKKNAYPIAVGIPGKLNYAYDLNTFSPITVWQGPFADVSNMWVERGEKQLLMPLGAPMELANRPTVWQPERADSPWPDSVLIDQSPFTRSGYRLRNSLPVFYYTYKNWSVEDAIAPAADRRNLTRTLTVSADKPASGLYCLLGSGSAIDPLADGSYAIDGKRYYLEQIRGGKPVIRQTTKGYDLLMPVPATSGKHTITYTIVW